MKARLILATAEGLQAIALDQTKILGRDSRSSIQLRDKLLAREHCALVLRDQGFVLRDLGSLAGTYVNGERVNGERALQHGDEIALGATRARYDDGAGPMTFSMPAIGPGAVAPLGGMTIQEICQVLCESCGARAVAVRGRDGAFLAAPVPARADRPIAREAVMETFSIHAKEIPVLIDAGETVRPTASGGSVLTVPVSGRALLIVAFAEASSVERVRESAREAVRALERALESPWVAPPRGPAGSGGGGDAAQVSVADMLTRQGARQKPN